MTETENPISEGFRAVMWQRISLGRGKDTRHRGEDRAHGQRESWHHRICGSLGEQRPLPKKKHRCLTLRNYSIAQTAGVMPINSHQDVCHLRVRIVGALSVFPLRWTILAWGAKGHFVYFGDTNWISHYSAFWLAIPCKRWSKVELMYFSIVQENN